MIDIQKIANEVAPLLGAVASFENQNPKLRFREHGPDCYLWLRVDGNRIEVNGHNHITTLQRNGEGRQEYYRPDEDCSITVSGEKSAEQVAKDIQRRCLPKYLKSFAASLLKAQGHSQYATDCRATRTAIESAIGDSDSRKDAQDISLYLNRHTDNARRFEFRINGNRANVTIDNLSAEQIGQIVELVKGF
jgi:hypothetical protein